MRRLALLAAPLLAAAVIAPSATARTLVVSPQGPYADLARALAAARDGDTIVVRGGRHAGPFKVKRQVRLVGEGLPVLDGHGRGTVVELAAPGAALEGFVVRGSGDSLEAEDTGIAVTAPGIVVAANRLEDVLFGVSLSEAHGSVVRGNRIAGKQTPIAMRGDPIRVWYSNDVTIEGNDVDRGRDVVLWYSQALHVRDNVVRGGRYGLHFMYTDDAVVERNRLAGNSVGAYLMYGRGLRLSRNVVSGNRGPSGFGLGLKDMDDVLVEANLLTDNRVGAYVDNSPRLLESSVRFRGNVFAFNDFALELMPSVRRNRFTRNSFVDNEVQLSVAGEGRLEGNLWAERGVGNYWSDYVGFDADGDGVGDVPYRSEQLYEALMDRRPLLRLFLYSPAAGAIDLAARAFPLVRPEVKLTDPAPLVRPAVPAGLPAVGGSPRAAAASASAALLALVLAVSVAPRLRPRRAAAARPAAAGGEPVRVTGLTKRYGDLVAVRDMSFSLRPGEAVALWGLNGAGKTTVLRCLLGLLPYEGEVLVAGNDVRRRGREARLRTGFVPQEVSLHDDLTVAETIRFYARLKRAASEHGGVLLERFGLGEHAEARVGGLSGGTRQRLALVLALLADPDLLLLDEPTASLDARSRRELLELLVEEKARGKAILFASHRYDEVAQLADRVLVLERGCLVAAGAPADVATALPGGASLRLSVDEAEVGTAVGVLAAAGFAASPNGSGIVVRAPAGGKGLPITLLAQAGIKVDDFELEERQE